MSTASIDHIRRQVLDPQDSLSKYAMLARYHADKMVREILNEFANALFKLSQLESSSFNALREISDQLMHVSINDPRSAVLPDFVNAVFDKCKMITLDEALKACTFEVQSEVRALFRKN